MRRLGLVLSASVLPFAVACSPGADNPAPDTEDSAAGAAEVVAAAALQPDSCSVWSEYRSIIGANSPKIMDRDGNTYVWAGGAETGPDAEWYEFTDAEIPAADLQYGIGKDRIRSIDDPVFVDPDDPRLLTLPVSRYRRCERPATNDEIMVIGYMAGDQPRAYPTALLDQHEVVNDQAGGTPFAVGW